MTPILQAITEHPETAERFEIAPNLRLDNFATLKTANEGSLVFCSPLSLDAIATSRAPVVIVGPEARISLLRRGLPSAKTYIFTKNPKAYFVDIIQAASQKAEAANNIITNENVIQDPTAQVDEGCILGGTGFNYLNWRGPSGPLFPHISFLQIEANVKIGAHSVINRGILTPTVIGQGTEMGRACYVAHGAQIGQGCKFEDAVAVAGSTNIGAYTKIGRHTLVRDGLTIGPASIILPGTNVLKSFPEGNVILYGNPARAIPRPKGMVSIQRAAEEVTKQTGYTPNALEKDWVESLNGGYNHPETNGSAFPGLETFSIAADATLFPGVKVNAGADIAAGARVAEIAHIGLKASIGEHVRLTSRVYVGDGATIGDETQVGLGARIAPHVKIGSGCVIGEGSVVLDNVPPGRVVWNGNNGIAQVVMTTDALVSHHTMRGAMQLVKNAKGHGQLLTIVAGVARVAQNFEKIGYGRAAVHPLRLTAQVLAHLKRKRSKSA